MGWGTNTYLALETTPQPVNFIARKLAIIVTESNHILASQHCPGDSNVVSDLLYFQGIDRISKRNRKSHPLAPDSPSNTELAQRFHKFLPQLIPPDFDILPLPEEIACFVTDAMQIAESSWILSKRAQTRTQTAFGGDEYPSATKKWPYSTHCSMTRLQTKPSSSFVPSLQDAESLNSNQTAEFLDGVLTTSPFLLTAAKE